MVAVEERLLPFFSELAVGGVTHHYRLPYLLAVALDVVNGLVVPLLFLLADQRLLHVTADVVRNEFIERLQPRKHLDASASVQERRLHNPKVVCFLVQERRLYGG